MMSDLEKYRRAFVTALETTEDQLDGLEYQGIREWDSVGHMSLIAELEETFDIEMETDDIIDLSSYRKGMEILRRYGIEL